MHVSQILQLYSESFVSTRLRDAFFFFDRRDFFEQKYHDYTLSDYPFYIEDKRLVLNLRDTIRLFNAVDPCKDDTFLVYPSLDGYATFVLSKVCKRVFAVEQSPLLLKRSMENAKKYNISNVSLLSDLTLVNISFSRIFCNEINKKDATCSFLKDTGKIIFVIKKGDLYKGILEERSLKGYKETCLFEGVF